jgi:hypothetical protein
LHLSPPICNRALLSTGRAANEIFVHFHRAHSIVQLNIANCALNYVRCFAFCTADSLFSGVYSDCYERY